MKMRVSSFRFPRSITDSSTQRLTLRSTFSSTKKSFFSFDRRKTMEKMYTCSPFFKFLFVNDEGVKVRGGKSKRQSFIDAVNVRRIRRSQSAGFPCEFKNVWQSISGRTSCYEFLQFPSCCRYTCETCFA